MGFIYATFWFAGISNRISAQVILFSLSNFVEPPAKQE
jgi:hypothetical protein